ncbi:MAG TPA: hypothetical protein VGX96_06575 [Candidatus Elarobacter sp.]|jgi:hypothetical protein|nr:hypothetical protein [Candidatus Elarobacter sp.]
MSAQNSSYRQASDGLYSEENLNKLVGLYNKAKSAGDQLAVASATNAIHTYLEGEALAAESFELQEVAAATGGSK